MGIGIAPQLVGRQGHSDATADSGNQGIYRHWASG
jgi:hypothetical protein